MRAGDCPRRFTLLAEGGVTVTYCCGEALTLADETAVDLDVLEDHVPSAHHHRRLHRH